MLLLAFLLIWYFVMPFHSVKTCISFSWVYNSFQVNFATGFCQKSCASNSKSPHEKFQEFRLAPSFWLLWQQEAFSTLSLILACFSFQFVSIPRGSNYETWFKMLVNKRNSHSATLYKLVKQYIYIVLDRRSAPSPLLFLPESLILLTHI